MNKERVVKFVKMIVAGLSFAGMAVSPENQEAIVAGFLAFYTIASGVGAMFKKQ